jgi:histidine triad (HIT) family protein
MTRSDDCVFCGIAAGTLPSSLVLESPRVLALMDIDPVTLGDRPAVEVAR